MITKQKALLLLLSSLFLLHLSPLSAAVEEVPTRVYVNIYYDKTFYDWALTQNPNPDALVKQYFNGVRSNFAELEATRDIDFVLVMPSTPRANTEFFSETFNDEGTGQGRAVVLQNAMRDHIHPATGWIMEDGPTGLPYKAGLSVNWALVHTHLGSLAGAVSSIGNLAASSQDSNLIVSTGFDTDVVITPQQCSGGGPGGGGADPVCTPPEIHLATTHTTEETISTLTHEMSHSLNAEHQFCDASNSTIMCTPHNNNAHSAQSEAVIKQFVQEETACYAYTNMNACMQDSSSQAPYTSQITQCFDPSNFTGDPEFFGPPAEECEQQVLNLRCSKICSSVPTDVIFRKLDGGNTGTNKGGWRSSAGSISVDTSNKMVGAGSMKSTGTGNGRFRKKTSNSTSKNIIGLNYLTFWYYIDNPRVLTGEGQIEIGSNKKADSHELNWQVSKLNLQQGWNFASLPISSGRARGGSINLTKINWFRIYHMQNQSVTTRLDHIVFTNNPDKLRNRR